MTVEEFYNLTERQISALIPVIHDSKHTQLKQQAALLGKKLKERPSYSELLNNSRTDEEEKALEVEAQNAYDRLKSRYIQGKLNGQSRVTNQDRG